MKRQLLDATDHRPFPLPEGRWLMEQEWQDILFIHWPLEERMLRSLIPEPLELDILDGAAWLTAVPLRVSKLRLRYLPQLPFVRSFLQLNLRTYVRYQGIPGIYFFSVETSNGLAAQCARWIPLPYVHAQMNLHKMKEVVFQFTSERITDRRMPQEASFYAAYTPDAHRVIHAKEETKLQWLCERYRMYYLHKKVKAIDIHHLPWSLQHAHLELKHNTLIDPIIAHAMPKGEPIAVYASKLHALLWPMKSV